MKFISSEIFFAMVLSLFANYSLSIFIAYLGIHLTSLQATELIIGLAFTARNFFQIFIRIPIGEFSQIIGRKPLLVAGNFLFALAFMIMNLAEHWVIIIAATSLIAVGMSCFWPALFAYIGDISKNNFGRINGLIFQGSDVGVIAGALFANYVLDRQILDLRGLFLISSGIGLFGTLVVWAFLPEVLEEEHKLIVESKVKAFYQSFRRSIQSITSVSKQLPLRSAYSYQVIVAFVEYFIVSFFPLLVVISFGYGESIVAYVLLVSTVVVFVFKPILGSISDKFGLRAPTTIGLIVNGFTLVLISFETNLNSIIVLYSVLLAASVTTYVAVNGATAKYSKSKERGLAMGTLGVYVSIGRTSSSIILAITWFILTSVTGDEAESLKSLFRVAGGLTLFVVAILFPISKKWS